MSRTTRQPISADRVRGARIWRVIRRVSIAALVFAAPVCLVSAQDAKVSVDMIGIGGMSCAHWPRNSDKRSVIVHATPPLGWINGTGTSGHLKENQRRSDHECKGYFHWKSFRTRL